MPHCCKTFQLNSPLFVFRGLDFFHSMSLSLSHTHIGGNPWCACVYRQVKKKLVGILNRLMTDKFMMENNFLFFILEEGRSRIGSPQHPKSNVAK
jgi:hypothetical protein